MMRDVRRLALMLALCCACNPEGSLRLDLAAIDEPTPLFLEVNIWSAASPADAEALCGELSAGLVDEVDPAFELVRELGFHEGERSPDIGLVPPGPTVFFARAREPDRCQLVATGCVARDLADGDTVDVVIRLAPLVSPQPCPVELVCDDAECRQCVDDTECDDDDPCTVDRCDAAACVFSPQVSPDPDVDGDGHCLEACGGGCDDCDDGNPSVNGGAARRCGAALDHDCDGVIDDAQGCDSCVPDMDGTIEHVATLAIDASQGLFVVGPDPEAAQPGLLYAVSQTEVTVCTVEQSGVVSPDCTSTPHGLTSPLPPAVVGEHLLLLGTGTEDGLGVYARSALGEGPLTEIGRWGTPRAMLVDRDTLFVAASPGQLWAVDIGHLPEIEEPPVVVVEDWAEPCAGMARAGDYLLGIKPLAVDGALYVAGMTESAPLYCDEQILTYGLPKDIDVFLGLGESGFLGVAQMQEGVTLIPLGHLWDELCWPPTLQDEFNHAEFPFYGCGPDGSGPCERAFRTFGFGASASAVLTREIPGQATRHTLYLIDVSPVTMEFDPTIGPSIEVTTGDTWEDQLFVSGAIVFVGTTTSSGQAVVETYRIPCS
jgi:hypothetical protein